MNVVGVVCVGLVNFADVRTGGGYGLMWTKTDKGEGGSIFAIFLRTSFMDDPVGAFGIDAVYKLMFYLLTSIGQMHRVDELRKFNFVIQQNCKLEMSSAVRLLSYAGQPF